MDNTKSTAIEPSTPYVPKSASHFELDRLLGRKLKVLVADQRWFTGSFQCVDRDANILLGEAMLHNTAFINFFCGNSEDVTVMFEGLLKSVFEMVPTLHTIVYFLPDSLILFPPFSSLRPAQKDVGQTKSLHQKAKQSQHYFVEMPSTNSNIFPYSLQVCQRKEFYPAFEVRRARVEDCDDLIPILKRNHVGGGC
ncbi:hypothetical protein HDU91_004703 [Kappamyces sp. JEL0680]|nr:hypothetical protein HDU91_004703 [Kappamyces sp. JEL0680]